MFAGWTVVGMKEIEKWCIFQFFFQNFVLKCLRKGRASRKLSEGILAVWMLGKGYF